MKGEKTIKVTGMDPKSFNASISGLEAHRPSATIGLHFSLNTANIEDMDVENFYREMFELCREHEIDITTKISGKWEEIPAGQLVLFPPPEDAIMPTPMDAALKENNAA